MLINEVELKKFWIISCFLALSLSISAQKEAEIGIRIGIQNHNIVPVETLSIESATDLLEMSVNEIDYGFHAGFYGRFKFIGLIWEPALLLNSQSISYEITSTDPNGDQITDIKKEYYQSLDIPLTLGAKIAFVKIHAGPVAHIHLHSTSELFDVSGYDQKFKTATYGYQAGLGLDIKKLRIQFNYEGNFNRRTHCLQWRDLHFR